MAFPNQSDAAQQISSIRRHKSDLAHHNIIWEDVALAFQQLFHLSQPVGAFELEV